MRFDYNFLSASSTKALRELQLLKVKVLSKMSKISQVKDADLYKLGVKIQNLREAQGLRRNVFAREAGISKHYFYRIEYGNANPSILELRKIANCLAVKVRDLIDF